MVPSISSVFSALIVFLFCVYCDGQSLISPKYETTPALPFPRCKAYDIECLRRGIRTFLIFMDSGKFGMKAIDPTILNSVSISLPEHQMSFLLRNVNVTGARWSKLLDRRFNVEGGKNVAVFSSDLHVTGEMRMTTIDRIDPYVAYLTMDIQGVESNITYNWAGKRGIDNDDYIIIGPERIVARNTRIPTFFLEPSHLGVHPDTAYSTKDVKTMYEDISQAIQAHYTIVVEDFNAKLGKRNDITYYEVLKSLLDTEDAYIIGETLQMKQSILDHFSNEITIALMHTVVDNFRLFCSKVAVKHYYEYY